MAGPLKISARVEIDGTQAAQGANQAIDAVTKIGGAADVTTTKLQQLIATSVGLHSGPANQNQRQWTGALAAEGLALDTLRAKYNPLFAVIQQYKAAQVEIRTAHAMGALSSAEMSAALSRERQETLASIDAIKGRNAALQSGAGRGAQGFQTANLAFQLQDIGSTAAFMPWWTVALQQGPQVSAVLSTMENKAAGLAAAFSAVLSPLSLVTIGVIGAGAAAIQYFTSMSNAAEEAEAKLEKQNELIGQVAARWGEALPNLKAYVDELQRAKENADLISASNSLADKQWEVARKEVTSLRSELGSLVIDLQQAGVEDETILRLQAAFKQVFTAVDEGKSDTQAMRSASDALAGAIRDTHIPALDAFESRFVTLGQAIAGAARQAAGFQQEALQALIAGKNGANLNALPPIFSENGSFYNGDQFKPTGDTPTPDRRPLIELDGLPGSQKANRAAESAATKAANSYRDLIKSADDRIAQMKLEAEMAGQTGVAADTLRFKLDLLQQGEEKGRALSAKQVEAINQRVEAFKQYAEAAASAKLKADLLFDREQLGRSSFDQQIASQLKGAGLDVDFDSYEAGLIRTNLQLEYARDLAGDFASTFLSSLDEGKSVWEAFGDAGVSALKKISDTLLNDVLNSLFQVNNAGSSGGGLFSGLLGGLFGGSSFKANTTLGSFLNTGFDGGGYTGPGPVHQPKGVVHAGEVVFSQADVARNGGVANVEAIRTGVARYASGGAVDVAPLGLSRSSTSSAAAASRGVDELKLKIAFDEDGNPFIRQREIAREEAVSTVRQGFAEYDSNLPKRVQYINANPRKGS